MGRILKLLSGSLGPYIMAAMLAALLGLFITTKMLWSSNAELQKKLAVSEASVKSLGMANSSNQESIDKLQKANDAWAKLFNVQKGNDALAVASANKFREDVYADAKRQVDSIRRERKEPDCEALMSMDIQRVCPATSLRMRSDAARNTD